VFWDLRAYEHLAAAPIRISWRILDRCPGRIQLSGEAAFARLLGCHAHRRWHGGCAFQVERATGRERQAWSVGSASRNPRPAAGVLSRPRAPPPAIHDTADLRNRVSG